MWGMKHETLLVLTSSLEASTDRSSFDIGNMRYTAAHHLYPDIQAVFVTFDNDTMKLYI